MTKTPHRTALITCAAQNAALACARSLHRAGWHVTLVDHDVQAKAFFSKACAHKHVVRRSPATHPDDYAREILDFLRETKIEVVVPVTDAAIFALLPYADELGKLAAVPWPSPDALRAAADKDATFRQAAELGFAIPGTWPVDNADALPGDLRYPLVIKPRSSMVEGRKVAVTYAADEASLRETLNDMPAGAFPVLLQERIVGPGEGYFGVWRQGEPVVECAHRRIREMPPSGGVSTLREAIALPDDMRDKARALLKKWKWHGPVMVEFKRGDDGRPYLMEVNGRLWGSLQLAVDAGVDVPLASVLVALDETVPPMPYCPGVHTRWLLGDFDATLTRTLKSESALHMPPDARSRGAWLRDFLLDFFRPGVKSEVFRCRDAGPFKAELRAWIANKWRMVKRRLGKGEVVTVAVHMHSTISYDGELSIAEIGDLMRKRGVQVCLLAEHDHKLTDDDVRCMVEQCAAASDESCLIVPGLEYEIPGGHHLIGYGVAELLDTSDPQKLCEAIRARGGLAVLAHPHKGVWQELPELPAALDGVEVWNTGHDGPHVPNAKRLRLLHEARKRNGDLPAYQGIDFHRLSNLRSARTFLRLTELSRAAVFEALRERHYRFGNRFVRLSSRGAGVAATALFDMSNRLIALLRKVKDRIKKPFRIRCWEYMGCDRADCPAHTKPEGDWMCWRVVGSFSGDEPPPCPGNFTDCRECDYYRMRTGLGQRRRRILHLIETGNPGGAEHMMLGLIKGLDRARYTSRVVLIKKGWLSEKVREANLGLSIMPLGSKDWRFVLRLARLVRRCEFDLLHSHEFTMNVYSFIAAVLSRRPSVATVHGNLSYLMARFRRRFAYQALARLRGPMIVVSEEMREQVAKNFGLPHRHLKVIPNGVVVPESMPTKKQLRDYRKAMNLPLDAFLIAVIGSLYPVKGQINLIEAMPTILDKHPKAHLAVIGRGKMREKLEQRVAELGIKKSVTFTGFREDAREALPAFDLIVVPSRYEGLSLLVIEAMASARPIVATHVGGNPEAIVNGESGLLVPPDDLPALADACLHLIGDEAFARQMGEAAQKRVRERFTREHMVSAYDELYRQLMERTK